MKRARIMIGAVLAAVMVFAAAPAGDVAEVVKGNNAFAFDLYKQLAKTPGNLVFSPYSLSTALAMTSAGARGQTAKEMAQVMRLTLDQDRLHLAMGGLIADLTARGNGKGLELVIANRLFGQAGYPFADTFLGLTRTGYNAELLPVDFRSAPEDARAAVNAWASEQTKGKITALAPEGGVAPTDRLMLTSAVYFKGAWLTPFDPKDTRAEGVFNTGTTEVHVPMMWQETNFVHGRGPGLALLELSYQGGDLAMVILLPDKPGGLGELEKKLTPSNLDKWLAGMSLKDVAVTLPRFSFTSEFNLADPLQALGLKTAFGGRADFTGIAAPPDEPPLTLASVVQKAFIQVNEEGTEAAAVTDIGMRMANGGDHFEADHPFIYLVLDTKTRAILFMGRVVDPSGNAGRKGE